MSFVQIDIELEEPFCCSARPLEGNETQSLPYIPATTLRGAAAWKLAMSGHSAWLEAMLGPAGPKWSPAWPTEYKDKPFIPTPACYVTDKKEELTGIRNRFMEQEERQWERIRNRFCELDSGGKPTGRYFEPKAEVQMHNALNYQRQATRGQELYSRGELCAWQRFTAWIETNSGLDLSVLKGEVLLGKRRSAGSGKSVWRVTSLDKPVWDRFRHAAQEGPVRFQLMTDAILPGKTGGYECGLSTEVVRRLLALDGIEVKRAWIERGTAFGWSEAWGLPREQAITIAAGSVCEFEVTPEDRRAAIEKLQAGIGIRRVEGFGLVAVEPEWLYQDQKVDLAKIRKIDAETRPPIDEKIMRTILRQLKPLEEKDRAKAKKLIAHSLRMKSVEDLEKWLQEMADHGKGWKDIAQRFRQRPQELRSLEHIRYWLGATGLLEKEGSDARN